MPRFYSTIEVARILNLGRDSVGYLIRQHPEWGIEKVARDYLISEEQLKKMKERSGPGQPSLERQAQRQQKVKAKR